MIKLDKINVSYGKTHVLNGLSLSLEGGKITAVIGRNGCGKTTMLRCLCDLTKYSGSIVIDGKDLRQYRRAELAKKLSLMPQVLPAPHVRVRELTAFGRSPHLNHFGVMSENDLNIVESSLCRAGCKDLADKYADELSGGELRRVFFAMMLCTDTEILLLDEPTANLDACHRTLFLKLLREICEDEQKTVAIVLHDVNDALEFADRIVAIDHGKCVFFGDRNDAINEKIPQRFFGLSPLVSEDEHGEKITLYR